MLQIIKHLKILLEYSLSDFIRYYIFGKVLMYIYEDWDFKIKSASRNYLLQQNSSHFVEDQCTPVNVVKMPDIDEIRWIRSHDLIRAAGEEKSPVANKQYSNRGSLVDSNVI